MPRQPLCRELIEREARAVFIDQSKIFNRSPRNPPLGPTRLVFRSDTAARQSQYDCK